MMTIKCLLSLLALCVLAPISRGVEPREISLEGAWNFALDPQKEGVKQAWFNNQLSDTIQLPGTTDEAKKGKPNTDKSQINYLSRPFPYSGIAWYQKEVRIPEDWRDQRICLFLERTKYTTVWVDGVCFGDQNSLATPHIYDLTLALTPGAHRLTIAVDSLRLPPLSGHQINENTQTNWNGMLGRLTLTAGAKVWIDTLRLSPDVSRHCLDVRVILGNENAGFASGSISLAVKPEGSDVQGDFPPQKVEFSRVRSGDEVDVSYDMGGNVKLWSEFSTARYLLSATLRAKVDAQDYSDQVERPFGMREFATKGTQFTINGKPTFLRGRVDCCVFPLTGYAPMDVAAWMRVFQICKDYGLNYDRCHTYCPPDAAFEAADRLGIYIQPELPFIGPALGSDMAAQQYARDEGERILKTYGFHPSFVMFSCGNEIGGGREARAQVVQALRSFDPTRLYTQASNYDYNDPHFAIGDDYWTTMRTRNGADGNVRGGFATVNLPLGFVQTGPPATTVDYTKAIADVPVPVIAHEITTFEMFPDFTEIPKYTGVLKPWDMEVYWNRVSRAGLLDQSEAFLKASGALSLICHRAGIEAELRTKNLGGFDILDLLDFPGQGMAIDGILNDLMESKGLITPTAWRDFCSSVVPLALLPRRCYTADETLAAVIKVANYGPTALSANPVLWSLQQADGREVASGQLPTAEAPQGTLSELGAIQAPLDKASAPAKLTLRIALKGTPYHNKYDIWVYPPKADVAIPKDVTVCRDWDQTAMQTLAAGGNVLLFPDLAKLRGSLDGNFASDYWCYPMFLRIAELRKVAPPVGTLGLLCDPASPALARFPTDFYTNWQWFYIVMNSKSLILDGAPASLHPIVQVIDNVARNYKLGLIFEVTVGQGKLLVCMADLLAHQDKPACRQLLSSLLAYAGSDKFSPATTLSADEMTKLFETNEQPIDPFKVLSGLKDDHDAFPMLRR